MCPLKYRHLHVNGVAEPGVAPDWALAPETLQPASVASALDRLLGVAVHAALARWQRSVDAGGPRRAADLLAAVCGEATAAHLVGDAAERALDRLQAGLRSYAEGPWPRLSTLFLEQSVRHTLVAPDGTAVELHLRVDRVVRHRRSIAILDFKTVSPRAFEMRADQWQLRTYALAAPDLLGVASSAVQLVIVDLAAAAEHEFAADDASLREAAAHLLACAAGIAAGDFTVGDGHPDRPCWSCGFRLQCPASLAPDPPGRRPAPH